jgi:hypothetical protein
VTARGGPVQWPEPDGFVRPLTQRVLLEGTIDDSASKGSLRDGLCLLLVCAICSSAYVLGLRHYTDDWFFLVPMVTGPDQSLSGLYQAMAETPFAAIRPAQIAWYIAFHKLAPGNVTIVHLANHAAFAAAVLVLYAALLAIPAMRGVAYYVALLYACLPSFSVAKMWYANHQAVLSLLMFALTMLLLTRMAKTQGPRRWWWLPLILLTAIAGNLFYEMFWVTALALPLFVWWGFGGRVGKLARDPAMLAANAAIAAALIGTTLFKLSIEYGVKRPDTPAEFLSFARATAGLYVRAAELNFWTLGVYSPRAAAGVLGSPFLQPGSLVAPLLVLAVLGVREWLNARTEPARPVFMAVSGGIAFGLGLVPYLVNFRYAAAPWGENNRGNIAAALGVALLVGAAFVLARGRWPRAATGVLIAFCVIGAFLQVTIGKMWVRAAAEQDRMLAAIVATGPEDRGTLLLYRTCPFYGAGPVFEIYGDVRGRMILDAGYRNLDVDLVRPGMRIEPEGIATQPASSGTRSHPYGSLRILDMGDGTVHPIDGPADARRVFAELPPERSYTCAFDFGAGTPLY